MKDNRNIIYGISDLIVAPDIKPSKYAVVFDVNGKKIGEVEIYIIGYDDPQEPLKQKNGTDTESL